MTRGFGFSDTGCVRANNEDYFKTIPELGLYVLADGMGGAKAGETASQLAVETVVEAVRKEERRNAEALRKAVEAANSEVLALARTDAKLEGMGTTLVAALDQGEQILIASVGDSRAYLFEGDSFHAITQDQSWVNEVGRPLGLDEASLRNHPLRHVLTMAIGAAVNLIVNYYAISWQRGSLLLLSSDGLHGVVGIDEMEKIVRAEDDAADALETKCRNLIGAAKDAGAPDNVTAVLVQRIE